MSRQIDLTVELSDEDRKFLEERADYAALHLNRAHLEGADFAEGTVLDDDLHKANGAPPADDSDHPPKSALKPEWVEYAVSQGMDPLDADNMTKDELVAKYTEA